MVFLSKSYSQQLERIQRVSWSWLYYNTVSREVTTTRPLKRQQQRSQVRWWQGWQDQFFVSYLFFSNFFIHLNCVFSILFSYFFKKNAHIFYINYVYINFSLQLCQYIFCPTTVMFASTYVAHCNETYNLWRGQLDDCGLENCLTRRAF